uniref:Uncharacterized protein n=1 Tax=Anguilla anguilla TaxID=7936 RepID=A0A0E9W8U1_ANGAN
MTYVLVLYLDFSAAFVSFSSSLSSNFCLRLLGLKKLPFAIHHSPFTNGAYLFGFVLYTCRW